MAAAVLLGVAGASGRAAAQVYLEVDPFAYPLAGFSVHAGYLTGPLRFEGGAFGLDVPDFLTAEDGWTLRTTGFVVDADYVGASQRGWFAGWVATALRTRYTLDATGARTTHTNWHTGPRAGYIWYTGWGEHLYIAPWGSIGYIFNPEHIDIGGQVYEEARWQPFLTIHIGWRF